MKQAVRRIANRDLASGFGAWVEMVKSKAYAMGKLNEIANRLNPKLRDVARSFYYWIQEISKVSVFHYAPLATRSRSTRAINAVPPHSPSTLFSARRDVRRGWPTSSDAQARWQCCLR